MPSSSASTCGQNASCSSCSSSWLTPCSSTKTRWRTQYARSRVAGSVAVMISRCMVGLAVRGLFAPQPRSLIALRRLGSGTAPNHGASLPRARWHIGAHRSLAVQMIVACAVVAIVGIHGHYIDRRSVRCGDAVAGWLDLLRRAEPGVDHVPARLAELHEAPSLLLVVERHRPVAERDVHAVEQWAPAIESVAYAANEVATLERPTRSDDEPLQVLLAV